jgi:imidazolonepropionase-like amidohydrolase
MGVYMAGLAFVGGAVIDGKGGHVETATVLVDQGRILAVEANGGVPDGFQTVAVHGKTVMPGMIDTHIHVVGGDVLDTPDYASSRRLNERSSMAAFRTVEAGIRLLKAGFTTLREVGARDYVDVDYREAVRIGVIQGPRMLVSGPGITPTGGHVWQRCVQVDGPEAIVQEIRRQWRAGVDCIKVMGVTGGVSTPRSDPRLAHYTAPEVHAAVTEAHRLGLLTECHAHALEGIRNAVASGIRTLAHGLFLDDAAACAMAEKGVYFVPTLANDYHKERLDAEGRLPDSLKARYAELNTMGVRMPTPEERMAIARRNGVQVICGTDGGGNPMNTLGSSGFELQMLVRCGYSPMDAIIASTSRAAAALRLDRLVGAVAPGMLADLLVVNGDPLQDIGILTPSGCRIERVFKEGVEIA